MLTYSNSLIGRGAKDREGTNIVPLFLGNIFRHRLEKNSKVSFVGMVEHWCLFLLTRQINSVVFEK
jgi:hypothetical protein